MEVSDTIILFINRLKSQSYLLIFDTSFFSSTINKNIWIGVLFTFHISLAVWSWASYLTFWWLSFHTSRMEVTVPSWKLLWGLNELLTLSFERDRHTPSATKCVSQNLQLELICDVLDVPLMLGCKSQGGRGWVCLAHCPILTELKNSGKASLFCFSFMMKMN